MTRNDYYSRLLFGAVFGSFIIANVLTGLLLLTQ